MSETRYDNQTIGEQLTAFPKPPVPKVPTSIAMQAKYLMLLALGFAALGGAFYVISLNVGRPQPWEIGAIISLIVAGQPALIGIILALWAFTQNSKLRQMAAGEYYVHWPIADGPWQKMLHAREQHISSLPILFAGMLAGFMLLILASVYFDSGDVLFDSVALHFLLPTAIAGLVGYIAGLITIWFGNMTDHIMRTHAPQVLLGPAGIYITGTFSPRSTFGQKLKSASVFTTENVIKCEYTVSTRYGTRDVTIDVPYPPAEEQTARQVAGLLNSPPDPQHASSTSVDENASAGDTPA